jgi:hypothetical protein
MFNVAKILLPLVPKKRPKKPMTRKLINGKYKISKYIIIA